MKISLISPYANATASGVRILSAILKKARHQTQIVVMPDAFDGKTVRIAVHCLEAACRAGLDSGRRRSAPRPLLKQRLVPDRRALGIVSSEDFGRIRHGLRNEKIIQLNGCQPSGLQK